MQAQSATNILWNLFLATGAPHYYALYAAVSRPCAQPQPRRIQRHGQRL